MTKQQNVSICRRLRWYLWITDINNSAHMTKAHIQISKYLTNTQLSWVKK